MTKVTILGQEEPRKELKKIEFVEMLNNNLNTSKVSSKPIGFKNIELICKNYFYLDKDLMFAYNDNRNDGILYIGHFNDGVV